MAKAPSQLDFMAAGRGSLPRRIRHIERRQRHTIVANQALDASLELETDARANLAFNASFEQFNKGQTTPLLWTSTGNVVVSAADNADGANTVKLTNGGSVSQTIQRGALQPVGAGVVSVLARTSAANQQIAITVTSNPANKVYPDAVYVIPPEGDTEPSTVVPNNGQWHRFFLSYLIEAASAITITIAQAGVAGSIEIDAVKIEAAPDEPMYVRPTNYVSEDWGPSTQFREIFAGNITTGGLVVGGSNTSNPRILVRDNAENEIITIGDPTNGFLGIDVRSGAGIRVTGTGSIVTSLSGSRTEIKSSGLYTTNAAGQAAFAVSAVDGALWGGKTLDAGDILIGRGTKTVWWDDSAGDLILGGIDGSTVTNINGANIQTGTITADRLNITPSGGNLVVNSSFESPTQPLSGWTVSAGAIFTNSGYTLTGTDPLPKGPSSIVWQAASTEAAPATTTNVATSAAYIPVDVTKPYVLSGWFNKRTDVTARIVLRIFCYDDNNTNLGGVYAPTTVPGLTRALANFNPTFNVWERWGGLYRPQDFPAGTTKIRVNIYSHNQVVGNPAYTLWIDNIQWEQADILTDWNAASQEILPGTIQATHLNVSTLSAISANMGTLTTGSIVIGSTNKLWLNDAADGGLAIGGATKASAPFRVTAAGALTATGATISGAITATSGSFTGDGAGVTNINGGNIQAGTITATALNVTNSGGNLLANSSFDGTIGSEFENWTRAVAAGTTLVAHTYTTDVRPPSGESSKALRGNATAGTGTGITLATSALIRIDPTKPHILSGYFRKLTSVVAKCILAIVPFDSAGLQIGSSVIVGTSTPGLNFAVVPFNPAFTVWERWGSKIRPSDLPAGTTQVKVYVYTHYQTSTVYSVLIDNIQLEQSDAVTEWYPMTTELLPGTIVASHINVSTLSAISANMGTITAGSIVIGSTNKLWLNDANDGDLAIGGTNKATAPFRVTQAGALTATNATISGSIDALSGVLRDLDINGTLDLTPGAIFRSENKTAMTSGQGFWLQNNSGSTLFYIGAGNGSGTDEITFSTGKLYVSGRINTEEGVIGKATTMDYADVTLSGAIAMTAGLASSISSSVTGTLGGKSYYKGYGQGGFYFGQNATNQVRVSIGEDNDRLWYDGTQPAGSRMTYRGSAILYSPTLYTPQMDNIQINSGTLSGNINVSGFGGAVLRSGQTNYNVGSGFWFEQVANQGEMWLGDETYYTRFSMGAGSSSHRITYDGTDLYVRAGTIMAEDTFQHLPPGTTQTISSGTVGFLSRTVDALDGGVPFYADRNSGTTTSMFYYDSSTATFEDNSTTWRDIAGGGQTFLAAGRTSDYVYIGRVASFPQVHISLTANTAGATLQCQYWNGTAWTTFTPTEDSTLNLTTTGWIKFPTLPGWVANTVNGDTAFFIRIRSTTAPTVNINATAVGRGRYAGNFLTFYNSGMLKAVINYAGSLQTAGYIYPGNASGGGTTQGQRYFRDNGTNLETNGGFKATGVLQVGGDLQPIRSSVTYTGGIFIPLQTPLTAVGWTGLTRSTMAKTAINVNSVFGVPTGAKAVLAKVVVSDSGSAAADTWFMLSPNNTANIGVTVSPMPVNSRPNRDEMIVPVSSTVANTIYYQVQASGTTTMTVTLEIWGYWL